MVRTAAQAQAPGDCDLSDWSLNPNVVLLFGRQKSGKTGYAFRYLLNAGAACNFIFDDRGQAQKRLGIAAAGTERECEQALAGRWVCFNPYRMFGPTKLADAFRWFCHWTLEVSKRGPGRKVLFIDEAWQFVDARSAPQELEDIIRTGRAEDLEILMATHRPSEYPRNVRALVTEWVCFNTIDGRDLDAVRDYYAGVDRCATLPKGEFLAFNTDDLTECHGKLF
jgi:hypothetical protein